MAEDLLSTVNSEEDKHTFEELIHLLELTYEQFSEAHAVSRQQEGAHSGRLLEG